MKKLWLILMCLTGIVLSAQADCPDWEAVPTGSTMIVTAQVRINDAAIHSSNVLVGAFAGSEARGASYAEYESSVNAYLTYLTISGLTEGETIHFKVCNDSDGVIWDVKDSLFFAGDSKVGDPFNPFALNVRINRAPVVRDTTLSAAEDTPLNLILTGSDADHDALTFAIVTQPRHGTLEMSFLREMTFLYTPHPDFFGADSLSFKANDGKVDSNIGVIRLHVASVNDAPVVAAKAVTTNEDEPAQITLTGSDADGDALTFRIVSQPTHGNLTGLQNLLGLVTYTPAANFFGADSLSFKANDGKIDSNIGTIRLNIVAVNDTPVVMAKAVTTNEDEAAQIALTGSDADGDALTFRIVSQPTHGNLTGLQNLLGLVTYTPAANFFGADSLSFKANDGKIDSNIGTIRLNIVAVNDTPVVADKSVTTSEDEPVQITLTGSDADNDRLEFTAVNLPAHGKVEMTFLEEMSFLYTPNPDYNGPDSFTFRANDGQANSNTGTVTIVVNSVNDLPQLVAISDAGFISGDTLRVQLAATDVEDSENQLVFSAQHGSGLQHSITSQQLTIWDTVSGVIGRAESVIISVADKEFAVDRDTFLVKVRPRGDVSGDDSLGIADVDSLRKHVLKLRVLTDQNLQMADMDRNQTVDIRDILKLVAALKRK